MLDLTRASRPGGGVLRRFGVRAPESPERIMWSAGAQLDCGHELLPDQEAQLFSCATGACSRSRARAVARSVGEAVERMALHAGVPSRRGPWEDVAGDALPYFNSEYGLGGDPGQRVQSWYAATRIRDGHNTLVPAGLVDYPCRESDAIGFDPGPSGAAAGGSWDAALKAALLETIERDAVIVAWARQLRLTPIDVKAALAATRTHAAATRLTDAVNAACEAGLKPIFAEVPASVVGVTCIMAGLDGPTARGNVVCLGASASDRPASAMLSAFEESFQLYYYLRDNPQRVGGEGPRGRVRNELERIEFLAGARGRRALCEWLGDPDSAEPIPDGEDLDVATLVERCTTDGLDPVVLDLSDRLPTKIRSDGWHVAKVVPFGFQPLRIDEATEFGWNRQRLESAPARTGSLARAPTRSVGLLPHPLP